MALEDEYSVEIPSDDLQNMMTVGDVMNYLKEKGVEAVSYTHLSYDL